MHCKAGLGRTGWLIAAWLMKEHKFTASEVIAYLRILRPGSVVGPQQNWLQSMQPTLWRMGKALPVIPKEVPVIAMDEEKMPAVLPNPGINGLTAIQPRKSAEDKRDQVKFWK